MSRTNNQFRIELPKEWDDQTVHFFMGPFDSGAQHTLTLAIDPNLQTRDVIEFARLYTEPWVQALPNPEVLKNEATTLENGLPVCEVVCKSVPGPNEIVFHKRWYVIMGKNGLIFTGNFSKKTIKTIGLDVARIINSLTIPGE
jgi:hypothetical protein